MRDLLLKVACVAIALFYTCGLMAQDHHWRFVTTGDGTTYAIDKDGTLWSWGWNESGQMGINGGSQKISTPTQVGTDSDWKLAVGGQAYAFFIKTNGTLWAVGDNSSNVSGTGDGATSHKVPVQVGSDADWDSLSCSHFFGHSSLAIKKNGSMWVWGDGDFGQLGIGYQGSPTPKQLGIETNWAQVSTGNNFTIALKKDGTIWGWGENIGQIMNSSSSYVKTPAQIGTESDWVKVFAVSSTAYAIKKDGTLWVAGNIDNNMSGLNDGKSTINQFSQITSINGKIIDIVGCEDNRYVAVGENGVITKVYSWGSNADGALGDGSGVAIDAQSGIETIYTPVEVKLPEGVVYTHIASGIGYCVLLSSDGKIYGWGKNRAGQLGNYCTDDQMTFVATPIVCTVKNDAANKAYTVDADNIPAQLNDAKKLILTGTWNTSKFQALTGAIGNNTGFPPAGNSTIEEIDMSQAKIEDGTSMYVPYGMGSYGVFRGLKALKKVSMPSDEEAAHITSLRSIFQNCTSLETVDISGCVNAKNLTDAFFGCENITSMDLSKFNNIVSSESMFDECYKLESVKLPANITLNKFAFGDCRSLKKIDWSNYAGTSVPTYPDELFQYISDLSLIKLIVPSDKISAFKADANWGKLNIVGPDATGVSKVNIDANRYESKIYTIGGIRVNKPRKGLYIVNGKKVLVK